MNKFEKRIKDELNSVTPDLKEKIKANVTVTQVNKEKSKVGVTVTPAKKEKSFKPKWVAMPIMAVAIVLVAVITPILVLNPSSNSSTPIVNSYSMVMSVNPSVELKYDENNRVTSARGMNKDGIMLLYGKNLVGQELSVVTNELLNRMNTLGYLNSDGDVKITVVDQKGNFNDKQYDLITKGVAKTLNSVGSKKHIAKMSEDEFDRLEDDIEANAKQYLEVFKDEIYELVHETLDELNVIIKNTGNLIRLIDPSVDIKDFDKLEDLLDSDELVKEVVAVDELQKYLDSVIRYGNEYEEDYVEDDEFSLNVDEFSRKHLFELYKELVDDLDEMEEIHRDLELGVVPDDLDDLIETILRRESK